jgi:hypothetical protein
MVPACRSLRCDGKRERATLRGCSVLKTPQLQTYQMRYFEGFSFTGGPKLDPSEYLRMTQFGDSTCFYARLHSR